MELLLILTYAAIDALPGQIIKGKVRHLMIDAIATGQLQATGALQDMGASITDGRAVAIIDIEDDTSGYNLPSGSAAQVAVHAICPSLRHHQANPAPHAELGELRVPGGPLILRWINVLRSLTHNVRIELVH